MPTGAGGPASTDVDSRARRARPAAVGVVVAAAIVLVVAAVVRLVDHDVSCQDFATRAEAQAWSASHDRLRSEDPLHADANGNVCVYLP
jgi:hypothetical protein